MEVGFNIPVLSQNWLSKKVWTRLKQVPYVCVHLVIEAFIIPILSSSTLCNNNRLWIKGFLEDPEIRVQIANPPRRQG